MPFQPAVKYDSRLRMALAGPSGAGKTYSALAIATALAGDGKVAVIDTERGSASKYADLFNFDVLDLDSPFHPDRYVSAIREAEQAGYSILVIDSLSHAWNGTGGLLEIVDGIARRSKGGNTYAAWSEATPIQNRLIDGITRSKLHIIATVRSKQDYAQERDERTGKTIIKKLGMAPIQRDGIEYEFDVFSDLDMENTLVVQKSRCPALAGQVISKPGKDVAAILSTWLAGVPAEARPTPAEQPSLMEAPEQPKPEPRDDGSPSTKEQHESLRKLGAALGREVPALGQITFVQASALLKQWSTEYNQRRKAG